AEAEALLEQAGWRRPDPKSPRQNAKGEKLRLQLAAASGQRDTERLLLAVAQQLEEVGIEAVLDLAPFPVFFGEKAKKRKLPHLAFYAWVVDESSNGAGLWR